MEAQDQRGAVSRLVFVLRRTTRIVQVLPFAYLLVLASYLLCESLLPGWALGVADNLLNIPIYIIIVMLGAGHLLKLCAWFRAACLMPLAVKAESWFDAFVITLTQEEVIFFNTTLGVLFLAFLVFAYNHFFSR